MSHIIIIPPAAGKAARNCHADEDLQSGKTSLTCIKHDLQVQPTRRVRHITQDACPLT
jgi:hypothetical protein